MSCGKSRQALLHEFQSRLCFLAHDQESESAIAVVVSPGTRSVSAYG